MIPSHILHRPLKGRGHFGTVTGFRVASVPSWKTPSWFIRSDERSLARIIVLQCGAPKIAKLVYNSNNYGLWYV